MNGIEIIILIGLIGLLAVGIGYFINKDQPSLKEMQKDYQNNEEIQEIAEITEELYNKDLRPIATKRAPREIKQAIPENIVKEPTKEEALKPVKKKRKYYPKKK